MDCCPSTLQPVGDLQVLGCFGQAEIIAFKPYGILLSESIVGVQRDDVVQLERSQQMKRFMHEYHWKHTLWPDGVAKVLSCVADWS